MPGACAKIGTSVALFLCPMEKRTHKKPLALIMTAFAALVQVFLFVWPAQANTRLTDIRTGSHKKFDRVVFELSGQTVYNIKKDDSTIRITFIGVEKGTKAFGSSRLAEIKNTGKDAKGVYVDITLKAGVTVNDSVRKNPFRVVLDLYPSEKAEKPDTKVTARPDEVQQTDVQTVVAFNDGWRWVYRRAVMDTLRKEVLSDDFTKFQALKVSLSLEAQDARAIINAASKLSSNAKERKTPQSKALDEIVRFFKTEADPVHLDRVLGQSRTEHARLGYFLLGRHYEKTGFFPEAIGYYSRVLKSGEEDYLRQASLFHKGRLQYFTGRQYEAKVSLTLAAETGFGPARIWIANAALVKGEFDLASGIYKDERAVDSVSLMSLGEMKLINKEFDEARSVFDSLADKYSKNDILGTYFTLKKGDAYLAEGRLDEAVAFYIRTKERLKSEAWAMAALSLADAFCQQGSEHNVKALRLYEKVGQGTYLSAEYANIKKISTQIRLGMYEEALASIKGFRLQFPASSLRDDARTLSGELIEKWTASLFTGGDYYGVAKVDAVHGRSLPFGKKAEGYLKAGTAAFELGLYDEAVKNLDKAVRIGNERIAEQAMITLGKAYTKQNDWAGSERLLNVFLSKYPESPYRAQAELMLLKASFLKGDYNRVASAKPVLEDLELHMLKARSLVKLKKYKEAEQQYLTTAELMMGAGETLKAARAYIGAGDAGFDSARYRQSIESYSRAIGMITDGKDADRSWALYRMARAYSILGKKDEMQDALKKLEETGADMDSYAASALKEEKNLEGIKLW